MENTTVNNAVSNEMAKVVKFRRYSTERGSKTPRVNKNNEHFVLCVATLEDGRVLSYNSYGFGHLESGLVEGKTYPLTITQSETIKKDGTPFLNYRVNLDAIHAMLN